MTTEEVHVNTTPIPHSWWNIGPKWTVVVLLTLGVVSTGLFLTGAIFTQMDSECKTVWNGECIRYTDSDTDLLVQFLLFAGASLIGGLFVVSATLFSIKKPFESKRTQVAAVVALLALIGPVIIIGVYQGKMLDNENSATLNLMIMAAAWVLYFFGWFFSTVAEEEAEKMVQVERKEQQKAKRVSSRSTTNN